MQVGIEPFAALLLSDNESSKRYASNMLFQLIMADAPGDAWEVCVLVCVYDMHGVLVCHVVCVCVMWVSMHAVVKIFVCVL